MTLRIANAAAIAACNAVVDLADVGTTNPSATLVIYDGTPPAFVDDPLAGNTVLAELAMANPAFGAAFDANPGGRATANPITDDPSANAAGTASFFRILDRDLTPRIQGDVTAGGGGGELEVGTTSFVVGARVIVQSLTVTAPEG